MCDKALYFYEHVFLCLKKKKMSVYSCSVTKCLLPVELGESHHLFLISNNKTVNWKCWQNVGQTKCFKGNRCACVCVPEMFLSVLCEPHPFIYCQKIAVLRELKKKKKKKTQVSKEKPFKLRDYWKSNLPISKIEITSNLLK